MSAPPEPAWKRWLDRLLMVNVLLVFIGAGVFSVAVVRQGQGHDWLMDQVQLLWQPLFAPACLLYTSPSPRDVEESRMPSSA